MTALQSAVAGVSAASSSAAQKQAAKQEASLADVRKKLRDVDRRISERERRLTALKRRAAEAARRRDEGIEGARATQRLRRACCSACFDLTGAVLGLFVLAQRPSALRPPTKRQTHCPKA